MHKVLIVDDDLALRETIRMAAEKVGHLAFTAADVDSARSILDHEQIDLVVSDIYMPGDDGLALLRDLSSRPNRPPLIVMTGRGTVETAMQATLGGAFDYIAKPFDIGALLDRMAAALSPSPTDPEVVIEPSPPSRMIGAHPTMVEVYKSIARVAQLPVPVLILGESGTGKELVARALHELGGHPDGPFVPINCGAIPDTLLESELFGHVRGAFTDARHDRPGALARANGGTVFLDEIGDISPAFQVKLLRFLQDHIVTPLGAERGKAVDARVVVATNKDLRNMVTKEQFRQDLYFRLAGYTIALPPLRERPSDIPLLLEHFKTAISREFGRRIAGPTAEVLDRLTAYRWPGNVRELEQVIRRAVIDSGALTGASAIERAIQGLGGSEAAAGLSSAPSPAAPPAGPLVTLDDAEREHILSVLRATAGNQTQAAFILGIERKTLARKLKRYQIEADNFKPGGES